MGCEAARLVACLVLHKGAKQRLSNVAMAVDPRETNGELVSGVVGWGYTQPGQDKIV